jgi:DNA-binding NarL/FixJ family response regulator
MQERPTSTIHVLVIDEMDATRERLCSLLSEVRRVVAVGCNADPVSALERFAQVSPHCVVIDPPAQAAGLELLAALRERDALCLIVVITNQDSVELKGRCLALGADHYLVKSTEFERVAGIVHTLAEGA